MGSSLPLFWDKGDPTPVQKGSLEAKRLLGTDISHILLLSYTRSLPTNMAHQNGALVAVDGPTLIYHRPKRIVHVRVHSWCCINIFFEFGHV